MREVVKDTFKTIAIVGAGQLGSRHLQGLAKIHQAAHIWVIDPNRGVLEIAQQRFLELPENLSIKSVSYLDSLQGVADHIDLAIISTNADVRREVIETLLYGRHVKYMIIEKVAFQSTWDFKAVMGLLEERRVRAWVNCPRRMYPFFKRLKARTRNASRVSLRVEGCDWGLASNAIHMLDLLAFLTDQLTYEIVWENLDNQIYESKRKGFIELGGELWIDSKRGDTLQLIDRRDCEEPLRLSIVFDGVVVELNQKAGMSCEYLDGQRGKAKSSDFKMPLQSELTSIQVDKVLKYGNSELSPLEESYLLHKPLLQVFNRHVSAILNQDTEACPIT